MLIDRGATGPLRAEKTSIVPVQWLWDALFSCFIESAARRAQHPRRSSARNCANACHLKTEQFCFRFLCLET